MFCDVIYQRQVWAGPLSGGDTVAVLLNVDASNSGAAMSISANFSLLGLSAGTSVGERVFFPLLFFTSILSSSFYNTIKRTERILMGGFVSRIYGGLGGAPLQRVSSS